MTHFDFIDKILYINLDIRPDRNEEILEQFKRANVPLGKVLRIEAVYIPDKPALGCTASHIKCLEYAIENNLKNVLILEDDFNFNMNNYKEGFSSISKLNNWDVVMISGNFLKVYKIYYFHKVVNAQTTSGYLVNNHYFKKLLSNYKESYDLLNKRYIPALYAIDIYFKRLQPNDNWYRYYKQLGYQRPSYSNITNKKTAYKC